MRWTSSRYVVLLFVLMVSACDTIEDPPPVVEPPPEEAFRLTPFKEASLEVGNYRLRITEAGNLRAMWYPDGFAGDEVGILYDAGIWLAARQAGAWRASVVWAGRYPSSNFTAQWGEEQVGVFLVRPDSLRQPVVNWPLAYGAPRDAQGRPTLYGDAMAWSAQHGAPGHPRPAMGEPLLDVRVTQAAYGFDTPALRDVLFVRYEITNQGAAPLEDLHIGFFADTDLHFTPKRSSSCPDVFDNRTGYDLERGISYTYPGEALGNTAVAGCWTYATGYTFVQLPEGLSAPGLLSHRFMQKNYHPSFPGYGEEGVERVEQLVYALQGLTNDGGPMIDPTTGLATRFAFTGDPLTGTGWIDAPPRDVRSLLSLQPVVLRPGETKRLTVAVAAARGANLGAALEALRRHLGQATPVP